MNTHQAEVVMVIGAMTLLLVILWWLEPYEGAWVCECGHDEGDHSPEGKCKRCKC